MFMMERRALRWKANLFREKEISTSPITSIGELPSAWNACCDDFLIFRPEDLAMLSRIMFTWAPESTVTLKDLSL